MGKRLVVIGGGIAGLTTAFNVVERAPDVEVSVLEASDQVGGNIRTDRIDGFTIERGPNGYLDNAPKTVDLVSRLGLADELQPADETAAKRISVSQRPVAPAALRPVVFSVERCAQSGW